MLNVQRVDWDDFRVFSAVARNGNFTRAARELRITEPTISRRIKRLEETIGTKLFTHAAGDAHLTHEGRRILTHTSAAEYAISQAAGTVGAMHEPSPCKIMAGDGISSYWLPQFLPAFMERHPNIEIALFAVPDRLAPKPPLFDLRIQYMESPSDDLVSIRLGTVHFTLFATRSYIRAHGKPEQFSDLRRHRILDLAFDVSDKGVLAAWAGYFGPKALFTNINGALCETIRYGGGIGLLPSFANLMEGRAVAVLPAFNLQSPLYLCFDREIGKRPAVRTMIEYLRDVVFDWRTMPWFAEAYQQPDVAWTGNYKTALAAACPAQKRGKKGRTRTGKSGS